MLTAKHLDDGDETPVAKDDNGRGGRDEFLGTLPIVDAVEDAYRG